MARVSTKHGIVRISTFPTFLGPRMSMLCLLVDNSDCIDWRISTKCIFPGNRGILSSDALLKKIVSCITYTLDTATKSILVCSSYFPPSCKLNSISSAFIGRGDSFGFVDYSLADALPTVCVSWRIDNLEKLANISNHGTRQMEFSLFDGREDNILVLDLWSHLKNLWHKMHFFFGMILRQSIMPMLAINKEGP